MMRPHGSGCCIPATIVMTLCSWSSVPGMAEGAAGEDRQPRNIYELVYAFRHTFSEILTGEELRLFGRLRPDEIRETNPEMYARISQDVEAWTKEWIRHVRETYPPVPEGRLKKAQQAAQQVDDLLRSHFADRGWPYKPLEVVFLPPRVFLDERNRNFITSGMFIPFYPEAFFASVDWPAPMELVLLHESLHFNKTGQSLGRALSEGVTETAAQDLAIRYELLTRREVVRSKAYPDERKCVELILDLITRRAGCTREAALEQLLKAYLTGDQDGMNRIFGADPWKRVIELSWKDDEFQTHRIRKALEE